ncbi:MAG: MoaD/ThiS family protein, partial [Alphaproteobacteria bacterium]
MVNVVLWGALKSAARDASAVDIEARDIRDLFAKLEAEYPGLKPHIERGIAVSINGRIFRDSWGERIPENAE